MFGPPHASGGVADRWPLATVLAAEPDPLVGELYRFLLSGVAGRVVVARDGLEALRQFVRVRPDLVLLSSDVPLVGAAEVLRRLKTNATARKTPVVLVRSRAAAPIGRPGDAVRPEAVLNKPFAADLFYETVGRLGRVGGLAPAAGGSLVARRQLHFEGYELRHALRSDAWSTTFAARQVSLRRPVVLKALTLAGAARPELVAEFRARSRRLAAISFSGLCRVIDSGANDATHYVVLQHVAGPTLADLVLLRALELPEILAVADRLFASLERAHRDEFVVGMLRPDTLLLDHQGHLRIGDYAAIESEGSRRDGGATASWNALETLELIAVDAGHQGPTRERDLCRATAMVYWLLTGELPTLRPAPASMFGRRLSRTLDELFGQVLSGRPPRELMDAAALREAVRAALLRSMRAGERRRVEEGRSNPLLRLVADAMTGQSLPADPPTPPFESYL